MLTAADAPSCSGNSKFDVYLTCREFSSWGGPAFKQLPPPVKAAIVDIGICHYLVLVKASNGRVLQLDFGPCGGDVHVSVPGANLARALSTPALVMPTSPLDLEGSPHTSRQLLSGHASPGVPGEVRERWLSELPSHMPLVHVGRTSMSLQQIREFNQQQPTYYLLHDNDCRHFANNLVQHMTGMHKATAVFLRQQYLDKAGRAPHAHPHRPVVEVLQTLTDVTNWSTIKQAAHTAAATIAPLFGMRLLGGFKAAPTRLVAGLKASKALTQLVKSKAGLAMAATIGWRAQAMTPAALAAASLTAGTHKPRLPWEDAATSTTSAGGQAAMAAAGQQPAAASPSSPSSRQLQSSPVKGCLSPSSSSFSTPAATKTQSRAARVSQSMTAALATYSTASSSQPLVQLLGHHVHRRREGMLQAAAGTVGRLQGAASRVALGIGGAGRATAATLMRAAGLGRTGGAGAGALVLRKPMIVGMVAAAPDGLSQPQPQRVLTPSAPAWVSAAPVPPRAAVVRRVLKTPARFLTRGASSSSLLLSAAEEGPASQGPKSSSRSARAAAVAASAFTAALQQQAARWYL